MSFSLLGFFLFSLINFLLHLSKDLPELDEFKPVLIFSVLAWSDEPKMQENFFGLVTVYPIIKEFASEC